MTESRELVFVYGTLRRGASNEFRMKGARLVGDAWLLGRLYGIDWYPGMIIDDEGIPVRGELYEVGQSEMESLDRFEGSEYERVQATVNMKSGGEQEAWVYEFRAELTGKKELIPADWLQLRPETGPPVFSLLTFALFPLCLGYVVLSWRWMVSAPQWLALTLEIVAVLAPLGPFLTARIARKGEERFAEGADLCAAVALVFFAAALIVRYFPLFFGTLPGF